MQKPIKQARLQVRDAVKDGIVSCCASYVQSLPKDRIVDKLQEIVLKYAASILMLMLKPLMSSMASNRRKYSSTASSMWRWHLRRTSRQPTFIAANPKHKITCESHIKVYCIDVIVLLHTYGIALRATPVVLKPGGLEGDTWHIRRAWAYSKIVTAPIYNDGEALIFISCTWGNVAVYEV